MLKFKERTSEKVTIPGKPILTGFKLFGLEDSGYLYNWKCIKPGLVEGLITVKTCVSISVLNSELSTLLNPTQSIVIRLTECLKIHVQKELSFHLFLDNLFVYWKSVIALKEREITVTETV